MSPVVRYTFRFILLLFIQYVLSSMAPLKGFIVPYIYFAFIIWLPFSISRFWLLVVATLYGLCYDFLVLTPGIHASACLLIAYLRPFILNLFMVKEAKEMNYAEPSILSMSFAPYSFYAILLIFIHHGYIILLQWLTVGSFSFFFLKALLTTISSIIILAIVETIFQRKQKTRASLT
jgi:hypothetical protein